MGNRPKWLKSSDCEPAKIARGASLHGRPESVGVDRTLGAAAETDRAVAVRVFADCIKEGYDPGTVARMVTAGLAAASVRHVGLVVLPAGAGRIGPFDVAGEWWTDAAISEAEREARAFAAAVHDELPSGCPPVVFGLDGAATFEFRRPYTYGGAVQLAVRVETGREPHLTWKSTPVFDESEYLQIDLDDTDHLTRDALRGNRPIARLGTWPRALLLVCHDGTAFGGARWLRRNDRTSWRVQIREQYRRLLDTESVPLAINLIHQLPASLRSRSRTGIPSSFSSGHANLSAGRIVCKEGLKPIRPMRCVAVAGLVPRLSSARYQKIRAALRCDLAHVDVRLHVR